MSHRNDPALKYSCHSRKSSEAAAQLDELIAAADPGSLLSLMNIALMLPTACKGQGWRFRHLWRHVDCLSGLLRTFA